MHDGFCSDLGMKMNSGKLFSGWVGFKMIKPPGFWGSGHVVKPFEQSGFLMLTNWRKIVEEMKNSSM